LFILGKYRGIRASDACNLTWGQVTILNDKIKVEPRNYKNVRFKGRWSFEVTRTEKEDDIVYAI